MLRVRLGSAHHITRARVWFFCILNLNYRMNPKADAYFTEGCGRCPLVGTPNCKVNSWEQELAKLRAIVLDCGLSEELKWRVPCYTFQKGNIVLISAF